MEIDSRDAVICGYTVSKSLTGLGRFRTDWNCLDEPYQILWANGGKTESCAINRKDYVVTKDCFNILSRAKIQ